MTQEEIQEMRQYVAILEERVQLLENNLNSERSILNSNLEKFESLERALAEKNDQLEKLKGVLMSMHSSLHINCETISRIIVEDLAGIEPQAVIDSQWHEQHIDQINKAFPDVKTNV